MSEDRENERTRPAREGEKILCDLCETRISTEDLRTGTAVVAGFRDGRPGRILCQSCRPARAFPREFGFLVSFFAAALAIPALVGLLSLFQAEPKEGDSQAVLQELRNLREEIRGRSAVAKSPDASNSAESEKSRDSNRADSASSGRADAASGQTREAASCRDSLDSICREAAREHAKKLRGGSTEEKIEAVLRLCRLREYGAVPDLLASLEDPDPLVRALSAAALGSLGARESVPSLVNSVGDARPAVRDSASSALYRLTGDEFISFQDVSPEKWESLKRMKQPE